MTMWKRGLLLTVGWLAVALGFIGIFLPILPTTPFLILAASCFAKSSSRFHGWLLSSPIFGAIIQDWEAHRYIKKKTRRWAMCVVAITFAISVYIVPLWKLKTFLIITMGICLFFMSRLPTEMDSQN